MLGIERIPLESHRCAKDINAYALDGGQGNGNVPLVGRLLIRNASGRQGTGAAN